MEDLKKLLSEHIDQEEIVRLTMDMVRIESHYYIQQQEKGVADYIKAYFDEIGIPAYVEEVEENRHHNVVATLDSGRPGRTLMLNGHMDTVRDDGMEDAFEPRIIDGEIWGRGTSDMKGPLASCMAAMKALKETGALNAGKVIFCGVADEEMNSIGTISLIESGPAADAAIVCEPTRLMVTNENRGLEWFQIIFKGRAVHGSKSSEGVNAITKAAKYIMALEEELRPRTEERGGILNVGLIRGGTQPSTVAGECELYIDKRYTTRETYESMTREFRDLADRIHAEDPDFKCEIKPMAEGVMKDGYVHGPSFTDENEDIVRIAKKYSDMITGEDHPVGPFPAWADAGLLSTYAGMPVIIMGPGLMECCHALDERMPADHLPKAALIYALTAVDFCEQKK